jgi:hypothetical protein
LLAPPFFSVAAVQSQLGKAEIIQRYYVSSVLLVDLPGGLLAAEKGAINFLGRLEHQMIIKHLQIPLCTSRTSLPK